LFVVSCVSVFFITSVSAQTSDTAVASEVTSQKTSSIQMGQSLFQQKCAVCHGSEGAGGVGVPLNLSDFLSTSSDRYLNKTIRLGRPGRIMPAFAALTDEQVDNIIQYIRSWKPEIKAPHYSDELINGDVANGREVYDSVCTDCHREKGVGGRGTGVTFSRPRDADIIAPAISNSSFLASASDQMIKQIIMQGRQSTPMNPADSMGLSESDVNDVVSYLRALEKSDINKNAMLKSDGDSVLSYESSYSIEETLENIKQAALGYNFRYIRDQTLDHGFVDKAQEAHEEYIIYFCNFNFLNRILLVDPRIGMFLPFRATIVKKEDKVFVMTVNPNYLCSLFNNNELKQECEYMSEKYESMLEESTL